MSSEPDVVEIYIQKSTRELLVFVPAAGLTDKGEELPEDAVFAAQFNIDDVLDGTAGMDISPMVQIIRKLKF